MNPLFLPAAGTSGELSRWYVHKKKAATIKSHFWLYLPTQTLHLAKPLQINLQSHSLIPKCVISLSLRPAPWHPWKNSVKNPWWIPIAFPRWKAVQTLHLVGGFNPPPQKKEKWIFLYGPASLGTPPPPTPWLWVCIVAPQYPPPPCGVGGVGGGGWWWWKKFYMYVYECISTPLPPVVWVVWVVVVVVVEKVVYVCIWMYMYGMNVYF